MNAPDAVSALHALAQTTRLEIFRRLVQRGPEGMSAGGLADAVGMVPSSLSFHLALLAKVGLIVQRRASRNLIYTANFDAMNGLIGYLTENCCGGAAASQICSTQEESNEAPARPRRRQRSR